MQQQTIDRDEVIDAYIRELEKVGGPPMPNWLASVERFARRRADMHDIEGSALRCGLWDVISGLPYVVDESIRRITGGTHGKSNAC